MGLRLLWQYSAWPLSQCSKTSSTIICTFSLRILIHKLVAKFSNNDSVKTFPISCTIHKKNLFFNEAGLRNWSNAVICDARRSGFQR